MPEDHSVAKCSFVTTSEVCLFVYMMCACIACMWKNIVCVRVCEHVFVLMCMFVNTSEVY